MDLNQLVVGEAGAPAEHLNVGVGIDGEGPIWLNFDDDAVLAPVSAGGWALPALDPADVDP